MRCVDDLTLGDLVDAEAAHPELFADPPQLAEHLGLAQSEVPKLIKTLETSRKLNDTINRITRPFRRG